MKEKVIDNEKLKIYIQITRITIVVCWISLLSFWAIKLFGGNWFDIVVKNENFIRFSNIVQETKLRYVISFANTFIANYLLFCAISQKSHFKIKEFFIVFSLILSIWAISNFVPLGKIKFPSWYGYVVLILYSIVVNNGWKKLFGIISILLEALFTLISFCVRNLPLKITENYLLLMILVVDYYIMLFLYYLYINLIKLKKEI